MSCRHFRFFFFPHFTLQFHHLAGLRWGMRICARQPLRIYTEQQGPGSSGVFWQFQVFGFRIFGVLGFVGLAVSRGVLRTPPRQRRWCRKYVRWGVCWVGFLNFLRDGNFKIKNDMHFRHGFFARNPDLKSIGQTIRHRTTQGNFCGRILTFSYFQILIFFKLLFLELIFNKNKA